MRCLATITAAACALSRLAQAVFVDDAGVTDWQYSLVGYPHKDATFFHQPQQGSKASLVYTLSDRNVVAAVNPKDGAIVWRQLLSNATDAAAFLRSGQTSELVVSGLGPEVVAWGASDGRQVWSVDFGESVVQDLETLELEDTIQHGSTKDNLVLVQGTSAKVLRLNGEDGSKIWEYEDTTGDHPHQVAASATHIYYVSLHKAGAGGYTIKITTLDSVNGKKLDQYILSHSDITELSHVLTVGANSASPIIAWTDKHYTTLHVNVIGTTATATFEVARPGDQIESITIHAPSRANSRAHFLVQYQTTGHTWAEVYHVDLKKSAVTKAYDLPRLGGHSTFSATSDGSNVYFTRVTEQEIIVVSSASHGIIGRWELTGFNDIEKDAYPVHVATELSVKGETISAVRSTVLLSSGSWVLLRDGAVAWTQPQDLAHTIAATFAYPSVVDREYQKEVGKEAELDVFSAYAYRWTRHIADLQKLPDFLVALPNALLSSVGLAEKPHLDIAKASGAFGFHKVIVCVTSKGQAIGLDAGERGQVLWRAQLPSDAVSQSNEQPYLTAYPDGSVELKPSFASATRYFFNSATGQSVEAPLGVDDASRYVDVIGNGGQGLIAVQEPQQGSAISEVTGQWWNFAVPPGETVISAVARPFDEPVASIGRVLGDRKVLYKYINPNLMLVATAPASRTAITIRIIDSLTGEALYTRHHADVVGALPFTAVVSENWFAYSFTEGSGEEGVRSSLLLVGDLYKSSIPDDRGAINGSDASYIPVAAYIISEPISSMTVSQTAQGISSKELIVTLPASNALVGIPRAVLDPRRPVDRDPTKTEQFEGLIRYVPTLDFDPKWFLSHNREVLGLKKVTTSPAVLESTSLVFAYGLDVFGTRVTPSFSFDVLGKDFNKLQMLATVFALGVGTFVVAPLVKRKQVNAQWSFAS